MVALSFLQALAATSLRAEDIGRRWAIGLNSPGVGVRYFMTRRYSMEFRAQAVSSAAAAGFRVTRSFLVGKRISPCGGIESDYVWFDGERGKGTGFVGEAFVGAEYYFTNRFSAQLDVGPAYVWLKDKDTQTTEKSVDYIMNIGINFYFGKTR